MMKKIAFALMVMLSSFALVRCQSPRNIVVPPPPPPTDTIPAPVLKNQLDSFSYAVGMSIAMHYKEFGVTSLSTPAVMKAVDDVIGNGNVLFTPDQANYVLNGYINKLMAEKALHNKAVGDSFLAVNRTRPGVKLLPSGLQFIIIREGTGRMPKPTDTVTVHYTGMLVDGTVFDSSVDRGEPARFTVDGVIKGWTEALQLMKAGSRWKLFIPADLAYGNYSPPGSSIPPGSVLIFDVELISVGN